MSANCPFAFVFVSSGFAMMKNLWPLGCALASVPLTPRMTLTRPARGHSWTLTNSFRMASRSPAVMFVVDATANSPVDAVSASESVVVLKAFCGMVCSLPDHPASQSFLDGRRAEENVQTVEVLVRGDLELFHVPHRDVDL